jgi:hypothetical protein
MQIKVYIHVGFSTKWKDLYGIQPQQNIKAVIRKPIQVLQYKIFFSVADSLKYLFLIFAARLVCLLHIEKFIDDKMT